jgi:hypothetical protein
MKRAILTIVGLFILAFAIYIIHDIDQSNIQIHLKKIELKNNEVKLKKLESDYNKLNSDKSASDAEKARLEKEKQDLEKQLQAKAVLKEAAKVYAASLPSGYSGCGDNQYANYIYMHESGCNTGSVNYLGCRGIGQSCPGSKLPCGTDYACQNAWFTSYCINRYGSWKACYDFWVANNWW